MTSACAALLLTGCLDDPVAPGPTPTLTVVSGAAVVDTIGARLSDVLVVHATDSTGAPLAGIPLTFGADALSGEPGALVSESPLDAAPSAEVFTAADGSAAVHVMLGERTGVATLRITHRPTGVASTATYTVQAGNAVSLQLSPKDTVITFGMPLQPRRYVYDRAGNQVTRPLAYTVTGPLAVTGGTVRGDGVGYATATASIDGQSASVDVTVVPEGQIVVGGWARTGLKSSNLDGTDWVLRDIPGAILQVDAAPRGRGVTFSYARVVAGESVEGPYERVTPRLADSQLNIERWPRFSDDGAYVYFEAVRGPRTEIWRARRDGGGAEQITVAPSDLESVGDRYPAISHSGDLVSYARDLSERLDVGMLEVLDLRTNVVTEIGEPALSSRWGPADEWIAFVTPDHELKRVRPNGADLSTLTAVPFGPGFDWSPDGGYIIGLNPTGDPQLLVLATGEVLELPHLGQGQTVSIAWYDDPDY